jgi:hypothetical protein
MPNLKSLAVVVLAIGLSCAAYAAPPGRGGGGGHAGGGGAPHIGGGGGGPHFGGGGGAPHFGGGGMRGGGAPHFGGAMRGGGVPHFAGGVRGGGAHFGGGMRHFGGGGPHFSGGGGRHFGGGGGRHFSGRSGTTRAAERAVSRGGGTTLHTSGGNRANGGNRNADIRSRAVRNALTSHAVAGALHNRAALRNPGARAQIAATAATAGWHDGRGRGWWRHGHGGYGWVGPLFWPFAYYDIYDYAMWGYDDPSFWDYGYNDIYAGMFAPYGYDDLAGYLPSGGTAAGSPRASQASPAANPPPGQLAQMCGDDSRDIAGLPIDRIQQAIAPNDVQRAALDDLANASVKAAEAIKAACPTQISLTAPARLAVMQQRVEAMIAAVGMVQPALDKFYGLLNDEQKARLNAIGQDQRSKSAEQTSGGSLARNCASSQPGVTDWPTAEIEARLHPTEAQRASLKALQDASAKAADMLKNACQPGDALTPPARLAAAGNRLNVMLQAIKTVRTALDEFYGKLTDEQKAQFEAIGPGRSASASSESGAGEQTAAPTHHHRRHHASIAGIIRHFMAFAR